MVEGSQNSMSSPISRLHLTVAVSVLGLVAATGCATKKYVRQQIDPITARVAAVEKQGTESAGKISELDERVQNDVSRLDEKTKSAQATADSASSSAKQAGEEAKKVGEQATQAQTLANANSQRLDQFDSRFAALGNWQVLTEGRVMFAFGRSGLSKDAKAALDELAGKATGQNDFAIEVQGFTDSTGDPSYNLQLSRRRADEVVRYLVSQHEVPLRRIHMIGMGEVPRPDPQQAATISPKENRRVDVKVYIPATAAASQSAGNRTPAVQ